MSNTTHLSNRNQPPNKKTLNRVSICKENAKWQHAIASISSMPTRQKDVVEVLLHQHANCDTIEPGQEYIANKARCCKDTVKRAVATLEEADLLAVERRGYLKTNKYTFSPILFLPQVTKVLKTHFAVLTFVFSVLSLSSNAQEKSPILVNQPVLSNIEKIYKEETLFSLNTNTREADQESDLVKFMESLKAEQSTMPEVHLDEIATIEGPVYSNSELDDNAFRRKDFAVQEMEEWKRGHPGFADEALRNHVDRLLSRKWICKNG